MDRDVHLITNQIITFLEFISTEDMIQLKKKNLDEYFSILESTFKSFIDEYYSIYQLLIIGNDITPLFHMIKSLVSIQNNHINIDDATDMIKYELAKKYITQKK